MEIEEHFHKTADPSAALGGCDLLISLIVLAAGKL
jgi:hypothetical protein